MQYCPSLNKAANYGLSFASIGEASHHTSQGVLGIGRVHERDTVMLGKWLSRYPGETDELGAKFFKVIMESLRMVGLSLMLQHFKGVYGKPFLRVTFLPLWWARCSSFHPHVCKRYFEFPGGRNLNTGKDNSLQLTSQQVKNSLHIII